MPELNWLTRNEARYTEYRDFLKEYMSLGHMEPVAAEDLDKVKHFIPHCYVEKPDSSTTKLRVLFDASAKTTTNISLNDIQMIGPTIQWELIDLSIDFRSLNVVLMADIAKMYRQVQVATEDT